jgi:acetyltransferase-like isoleucine patch superfamily enzyme
MDGLIRKVLANARRLRQVIWARIALRACTSVGRLARVEGRVMVRNAGTMILGERVRLRGSHVPIELATYEGGELVIGARTSINSGTSICAQRSVIIGANCGIGNYTLIMDTDFHDVDDISKGAEPAPVRIHDNAWLASRVTILKGVTVGEGAVVSAGSVVAVDVPPYTLVGGVPARIIRKLERRDIERASPTSGRVPEIAAAPN